MVQTRSQRTITIQSLPRELLAHCLAFLPFADMVGQNFLWWKHRPYISFAALVRNYWEDSQLAGTLLDVLEEYGEGYVPRTVNGTGHMP